MMKKQTSRLFAVALLPALLSACVNLAPQYESPDMPVASQWPAFSPEQDVDGSLQSAAQMPWQSLIEDEKLRQLIQMALENNRDLRIAALNIERTRAQYQIQRAALFPEIAASGGQVAQHMGNVTTRTYSLGVGISSYELDLFGRVRNLQDAALEMYLATEASRQATHISLVSQVTGSYMALAADMDTARLARETLRSRQQHYDLQVERAAAGVGSDLTLRQAEGELETARANVLSANLAIATDRNALELLLGSPLPNTLLPGDSSLQGVLSTSEVPPGLPSDLLLNRPDIKAAEHKLLSAHANIGAARAAFFPTISLTASVGRASNELSNLFDGGGSSWSFAPQIYLPIFNGGRLRAQKEISEVDRKIAVAEYERSIQSAFREVSDALAQRQVIDGQLVAQQKRTGAAQAAHDLIQTRYDNGIASYLEVLDAQRTLFAAQQILIQTQLARQSNLITLYKAIGGGWSGQKEAASANFPDDASNAANSHGSIQTGSLKTSHVQ